MGTVLAFSPKTNLTAVVSQGDAQSFRDELLGFFEEVSFPGHQYLDEEFGAAISREAHDRLSRLFTLCGITELDPSGADFDLVLNTWYELLGVAGEHLRLRHMFKREAYDVLVPKWTDAYRQYVEALWNADAPEILRCARLLGIHRGIPEGVLRAQALYA